ncbi:mechanosensitive ion channel protein 4/5/6/7/8/9/10 [Geosmithia morbida]|uniref:Mechanosensitive ion channel protein 4/5/6/7/8/9/10 n=1 Tax=Geosmithia morbida TaxID=1094350 RepID=A0A9P5D179_9HYPO|nr:mechanosensitive ion channel protein 4/5/6/7/8/9/10 [Geosmithia morbida]KAF4123588.1 mechanosensitive ion channel protein 4/5/6/7/8/9/10 [Geosmithia morbida]
MGSEEEAIRLTNVRSNASRSGAAMAQSSSVDSSHFEKNPALQQEEEHKKHHHFGHRGRRRRATETLDRGDTGLGSNTDSPARLNFMGRLYRKVISFSVVSRYLVYIVPVAVILAIPVIVLAATGHKNDIPVGNKGSGDDLVVGPPLFKLMLWIEVTWLTVWAAKLVAWALPNAFMFFSGIVSAGTRKYATVLANMSVPLTLFFWALAVWITFKKLFSASTSNVEWARTLHTILGALFVSSAVFLGEKAIVQVIGVSYHQRSFANRISESKHEIRLLGMLYDASRTLFPMYCPDFAEEDHIINDSIELKIRGMKGGSGTATPMKLINDFGRLGDKVTSAFGNIASEITGKHVFNPNSAHSIVLEALDRLRSSEALARRIWMSFVVDGNDDLYLEDVIEVLGPAHRKEAEEAFAAIDGDENGDISLDEMVRKVIEIGKERKAIGEGMKDIGQALAAFDKVLLFVVLLIIIFVFLAFFQSSFVATLASAGTALLSLSFVFAVTTQEFLGSCIFLFVKHPYDVGDRVVISDVELVVQRISLLYTIFTRSDTEQVSQVPNIVLNNLWVDNMSRSKAMYESFEIDVSFDTSFEDIELLRLEMEKFVRDRENSRDFKPDFSIGVGSVGNMDKLTLQISILHKSNWHNAMVRASRRSKFMCALALALKKIPIYGPGGGGDAAGGPANPTYSVSVTDEWAAMARDKAAKVRNEERLVPFPEDAATKSGDAEAAAIQGITKRPPVREMGAAGTWDESRSLRVAPPDNLGRMSSQRSHRSFQSQRSLAVDGSRSNVERASTRGRRKAGETMPASAVDRDGSRAPNSPSISQRGWDEEAQMEVRSPTSPTLRQQQYSTNLRPYPSHRSGQ